VQSATLADSRDRLALASSTWHPAGGRRDQVYGNPPGSQGLGDRRDWYGLEFQHTAVNTECKYLLLRYAFETLGTIRVQFKADMRNERSRHAIERIGRNRKEFYATTISCRME